MRISRTGADTLAVSGGNLSATVVAPSVQDIKEDIQEFNKKALNIISQAKVKSFKYKERNNKETKIGLLAEESPDEILTKNKDGNDIYSMVTLAWKAIQELNEAIQKGSK